MRTATKVATSMAAAGAGSFLGRQRERAAAKAGEYSEAMGRWWALPFTAAQVGLEIGAHKLFGDNERLFNSVISASIPAFVGSVIAGAVLDKLFRRHEVAEKAAMFIVGGLVTVGGGYLAAAANGNGDINGMQPGSVFAAPFGEVGLGMAAAAPAAALGMLTGDALHKDAGRPRS